MENFQDQKKQNQQSRFGIQSNIMFVPQFNAEETFTCTDQRILINTQANSTMFVSTNTIGQTPFDFSIQHNQNFEGIFIGYTQKQQQVPIEQQYIPLYNMESNDSIIVNFDSIERQIFIVYSKTKTKKILKIQRKQFFLWIKIDKQGNFLNINNQTQNEPINNILNIQIYQRLNTIYTFIKKWDFFIKLPLSQQVIYKIENMEGFLLARGDVIFMLQMDVSDKKKILEDFQLIKLSRLKQKKIILSILRQESLELSEQEIIVKNFIMSNLPSLNKQIYNNSLLSQNNFISFYNTTDAKKTLQDKYQHYFLEKNNTILIYDNEKMFKLQSLYSKSTFIISPFIFDINNINITLERFLFEQCFVNLKLSDFPSSLCFSDEHYTSLSDLFNFLSQNNNLYIDDDFVHFRLPQQLLQNFIHYMLLFVYINTFKAPVDQQKVNIPKDNIQEKKRKNTTSSNQEDYDFSNLFDTINRENFDDQNYLQLQGYINNIFSEGHQNFPNLFDIYLRAALLLEEALYRQSYTYRVTIYGCQRPHVSFERLSSFINSSLDINVISQIIDYGIFINSAFEQEFKMYKNGNYPISNFSDTNIRHNILQAYDSNQTTFLNDREKIEIVPLSFTTHHLPPLILQNQIKHFTLDQEKNILIIIDEKCQLSLFSLYFGISLLYSFDLKHPPFISPLTFEASDFFQPLQDKIYPLNKDIYEKTNAFIPQENINQCLDKNQSSTSQDTNDIFINNIIIEQLLQMGFPIILLKNALQSNIPESIDSAINIIQDYQQANPLKKTQNEQSKNQNIKEEWQCKMCTYINRASQKELDENICEMCMYIADKNIYQNPIDLPIDNNLTQSAKDNILQSFSQIINCSITELKNNSSFQGFLISILVKKYDNNDSNIIYFYKLGPCKTFFKNSLFINYVSDQASLLQDNKIIYPNQLDNTFPLFSFDNITKIAPLFNNFPIFNLQSLHILDIDEQIDLFDISCFNSSLPSSPSSNFIQFYFSNKSTLNRMLIEIINTDIQVKFPIKKQQLQLNEKATNIYITSQKDVFISTHNFIQHFTLGNDNNFKLCDQILLSDMKLQKNPLINNILIQQSQKSIFTKYCNTLIANNNNLSLLIINKSDSNNQFNNNINPQCLLREFKNNQNIGFNISQIENLYCPQIYNNINKTYEITAYTANNNNNFNIDLQCHSSSSGLSLIIEAFYSFQKDDPLIQNFLQVPNTIQRSSNITTIANFTDLPLQTIHYTGQKLSNAHHVSQMLQNDNEYFSTKDNKCCFIFQNSYEHNMLIKRITLSFGTPEQLLQSFSEVLIVIFKDLSFAKNICELASLNKYTIEYMQKCLAFDAKLGVLIPINLSKNDPKNINIDLQVPIQGKYVALIPISTNDQNVIINYRYFGIGGTYVINDNNYSPTNIVLQYDQLSTEGVPFFRNNDWSINNQVEELLFFITDIQQTKRNTIAKFIAFKNIKLLNQHTLAIKHSPLQQKNQLINFKLKIQNVFNQQTQKIKEELNEGYSKSLSVEYITIYNQQLIDQQSSLADKESYFIQLCELFQYLNDAYGPRVPESFQALDFKNIILLFIINCQNTSVIQQTKYFFEKIFKNQQCLDSLFNIFLSILESFFSLSATPKGIEHLWQLVQSFQSYQPEDRKKCLNDQITIIFKQLIQQLQQLNNMDKKILTSLQIDPFCDGKFNYKLSYEKQQPEQNSEHFIINNSDNFNDLAPKSLIIDYQQIVFHQNNYSEYFLLLNNFSGIQNIFIKCQTDDILENVQINVKKYDHNFQQFSIIRTLNIGQEQFSQFLLKEENSSLQNYFDICIPFTNSSHMANLLSFTIQFTKPTCFNYSIFPLPKMSFFIYGQKYVKESFPQQQALISEKVNNISLFSKKLYNDIKEQLQRQNIQLSESDSEELYDNYFKKYSFTSTPEKKTIIQNNIDQQNNNNNNQTLDSQSKIIHEYIQNIITSDINDKIKIKTQLEEYAQKYNHLYQQEYNELRTIQGNVKNLSFTLLNIEHCLNNFLHTFPNFNDFQTIYADLFYNTQIFEYKLNTKTIDYLIKGAKFFEQHKKINLLKIFLLQFLQEPTIIFILHIDAFIQTINTYKQIINFSQCDIIEHLLLELKEFTIEQNNQENLSKNDTQLKKIILYSYLLNNLEAHKVKSYNSQYLDNILSIQKIIFDYQLHSPYVNFQNNIVFIIKQIFLFAQMDYPFTNNDALIIQEMIIKCIHLDFTETLQFELSNYFQQCQSNKQKKKNTIFLSFFNKAYMNYFKQICMEGGSISQKHVSDIVHITSSHEHMLIFDEIGQTGEIFKFQLLDFMDQKGVYNTHLWKTIIEHAFEQNKDFFFLQKLFTAILKAPLDQRSQLIQEIILITNTLLGTQSKAYSDKNSEHIITWFLDLLIDIIQHPSLLVDSSLTNLSILIISQLVTILNLKSLKDKMNIRMTTEEHIIKLLHFSSTQLITHFNLGGPDNFTFFDIKLVQFADLISRTFYFITHAIDKNNNPLLQHIALNFDNYLPPLQKELLTSLINITNWLGLNYQSQFIEPKAVIGPKLKIFQTELPSIIHAFMDNNSALKIIINNFCQNFFSLNQIIINKFKENNIGFLGLALGEQSTDFYEYIIEEIKKNKKAIQVYINDNKGIEQIIDLLNKLNNEIEQGSHPPLFKLLQQQKKTYKKTEEELNISLKKDKKLFEQEQGSLIRFVHDNSEITNGSNIKDWSENKNGKAGTIYHTSFGASKRTIQLKFKITEPFELKSFILGINVSKTDRYILVGSSPKINLFGTFTNNKGEQKRTFIGELKAIEDPTFLQLQTIVYALNPNYILFGQDNQQLQKHIYLGELKQFDIIIERPVLTIVDKISPYIQKTISYYCIAINFISIEGFSQQQLNCEAIYKQRLKGKLYDILQNIFKSDAFEHPLSNFFDAINDENSNSFYNKINLQLPYIMKNYSSNFAPLIIVLANKSSFLSNAIFTFLLNKITDTPSMFELIEIILIKRQSFSKMSQLCQYAEQSRDPSFLNKISTVLSNYIISFFECQKSNTGTSMFILPLSQQYFYDIIDSLYSFPLQYYSLKFTIICLRLLSINKMQLSSNSQGLSNKKLPLVLVRKVLSKLDEKLKPQALQLLGYIIIHLPFAKREAINSGLLTKILLSPNFTNKEDVPFTLSFINSLTEHQDTLQLLIKSKIHRQIFSLVEQIIERPQDVQDKKLINLINTIIFNIFKSSRAKNHILYQKLFALFKKHKNNEVFIFNIFLPILRMQKQQKIILFTNDKGEDTPIDNKLSKISTQFPQTNNKFIPSDAFNDEQHSQIKEKLCQLIDIPFQQKLATGHWTKVIETTQDEEDFSHKFDQLTGDSPLAFILKCIDKDQFCTLSIFTSTGFHKETNQSQYKIANSDNNFIILQTGKKIIFYKLETSICQWIFIFNDIDNEKCFQCFVDGYEKLSLSMTPTLSSTIDLYPIKPFIGGDTNENFDFPYDIKLNSIEVFKLRPNHLFQSFLAQKKECLVQNDEFVFDDNIISHLLSIFSSQVVLKIPEAISDDALFECLQLKNTLSSNKNYSPFAFMTRSNKKDISFYQSPKKIYFSDYVVFDNHYTPKHVIFDLFIKHKGIDYMIEQIIHDINNKPIRDRKDIWLCILQDLQSYITISGFLSLIALNKDFLDIIFILFTSSEKSLQQNWQEIEIQIMQLLYEKLSFLVSDDKNKQNIINVLFRLNTIDKILRTLQFMTSEISRKYCDGPLEQATKTITQNTPKDQTLIKEVKKKKGVGYEKEGTGTKWIINDYFVKKKQKSELILSLIDLLTLLLNNTDQQRPFFNDIAESCLLPLLESAFLCSSLSEMSKDFSLYRKYCELLIIMAKNHSLAPLLSKLPKTYRPIQFESIIDILKKQDRNLDLFISLSKSSHKDTQEGVDKSIELGIFLQQTIKEIQKLLPSEFDDIDNNENGKDKHLSKQQLDEIQQLSLNDKYKKVFEPLRFGLFDMKNAKKDEYDHHYKQTLKKDSDSASQQKLVRLAQEIADMNSSLPIDSYNLIIVRADDNRLDVMKALIAGAEDTPYANGLFEYHVYLPPEYPLCPPKCNLDTTGAGDVRFNPNLYACGKVCISLLGTWRGSATENWDPKISNLLQLFLSIQSVIMSEEVYFNEPGYEGESGTLEGEKKNEAYSNIVRLCNIKYAMLAMIKKPTNGFEEIIHKHFYLKRDVILKEVGHWVRIAEVRQTNYTALVQDHNYKYATRFNSNPQAYITELKEAIQQLELALKELYQTYTIDQIFTRWRTYKKKKVPRQSNNNSLEKKEREILKLKQDVDISLDTTINAKNFNADDQEVADRWSRYIGAMGIEAVRKQASAKVAIFGLNCLGAEIAKNIILSGVQKVFLFDYQNVTETDMVGQFYLSKDSLGLNRAQALQANFQQLNAYVTVSANIFTSSILDEYLPLIDVIILSDFDAYNYDIVLQNASKMNKKIILADVLGVYGRILTDFGINFDVLDRDGEEPCQCYIESINSANGKVTLMKGSQNQLREGDFFTIQEAITSTEGQKGLKQLNGSIFKIKKFDKITEFYIEENLLEYEQLLQNGLIKELKTPKKINFKQITDLTIDNYEEYFDDNLLIYDFDKINNSKTMASLFLFKEFTERTSNQKFQQLSYDDISHHAQQYFKDNYEDVMTKLKCFYVNAFGCLPPLCAFIGGLTAQECIKAITGKYQPIQQLFTCDYEELLSIDTEEIDLQQINEILNEDYGSIKLLIGKKQFELLQKAKIFMIGTGAIGCELLKNCAMCGIGSQAENGITITDPDNIELSNLSRQFLFREKHIGLSKSIVASKVIENMNKDYVGRINAQIDRLSDKTEDLFSDTFFQQLTICLNALDNIQARIYVDRRCVRNRIPLIESGTLGPKGHVQVIIPFFTENYGQVKDPSEEDNIPVCTLKMFPEEALHCMEWAKEQFDSLFNQKLMSLIQVLEEYNTNKNFDNVEGKIQKIALSCLTKLPKSYSDALQMARKYYEKHFTNKIKQLVKVYPQDFKNKEGKLFWTLPKRFPSIAIYDNNDPVNINFIKSFAKLICFSYGIKIEDMSDDHLHNVINQTDIPLFKFCDKEQLDILQAVENEQSQQKITSIDEQKDSKNYANELIQILSLLDTSALQKQLKTIIFEKDNDQNGHVDFLYYASLLRCQNYCLEPMKWLDVKLKAGKIMAAMATTTSVISALQSIEALKVILSHKKENLRNAFTNLAISSLTLSEPGDPTIMQLQTGEKFTIWDIWQYALTSGVNDTFGDFFNAIQNKYKIYIMSVMQNNKPIFLRFVHELDQLSSQKLTSLFEFDNKKVCFISIACKYSPDDQNHISYVPPIKIEFI